MTYVPKGRLPKGRVPKPTKPKPRWNKGPRNKKTSGSDDPIGDAIAILIFIGFIVYFYVTG